MSRNRQLTGACKPDRRVRAYAPRVETFERKTLLSTSPVTAPRPSAPGDYEGIGKTDLAVYRPTTGEWVVGLSTGGTRVTRFGDPRRATSPCPATTRGPARPTSRSSGRRPGQWIIQRSDGSQTVERLAGFVAGDLPVPGDYEGIGKTDLALYRPTTGQWFIQLSTGSVVTRTFGDPTQGDIPVPGNYDGRGAARTGGLPAGDATSG